MSLLLGKSARYFFAGAHVDVKGNFEVSRAKKLLDDSKEDSEVSKNVILKFGSPHLRQDHE